MIYFFSNSNHEVFAVQSKDLSSKDLPKLSWLFGGANYVDEKKVDGPFIGPRATMVSPWSTNAVEITQNMGIQGVQRIERYEPADRLNGQFDPMLAQQFHHLDQTLFDINIQPEPVKEIQNIAAYNESEGLALSPEEVDYLENLSDRLNRPLTDSEVFGFSQVNSEHCRHKIFNGVFIIDGEEKKKSLFKLIKETSAQNPNEIVSAYKDNVAFIKGPKVKQFAPQRVDEPSLYTERERSSILSLKAETHNFPTTVEPFNGALQDQVEKSETDWQEGKEPFL